MSTYPARGEDIVAHFRTFVRRAPTTNADVGVVWAENWSQGETTLQWGVPNSSSTIQGILCCLDQDVTISWLLLISDPATFSYLAVTFGTWDWAWVKADGTFTATREFIDWIERNDETQMVSPAQEAQGSPLPKR